MKQTTTVSWRLYDAGREYNRRISLYSTIRKNERFYRGDQWYGIEEDGLPHPVFNIVRRVTDYLVSSVGSGSVGFSYVTDDVIAKDKAEATRQDEALRVLSDAAAGLWKDSRVERRIPELLLDAALTGDAAVYCRWNGDMGSAGGFSGNVETERIDGSNLFLADVSSSDIQSQAWVMLAGRASVEELRRDAALAGINEAERAKILPDDNRDTKIGDLADALPTDDYATFLIRFRKDKDGNVVFRKSTREVDFPEVHTKRRIYPIALFNWYRTRGSYHGTSPITSLLPNQRFLNLAYALCMKHMRDTAFSKVIYDQSRIPEWSNEVGEAIAAVGGGNISDAVSVVGTGKMAEGYQVFIDRVTEATKEMMGATDTVLGSAEASNTSAILALQEASRVSLGQVVSSYTRFLEEIAEIWADLIRSAYPPERPVPSADGSGTVHFADFSVLDGLTVRALAEIAGSGRYSASETVNVLDKLLSGGHITAVQYLERLPSGLLAGRDTLLAELRNGQGGKEGNGDGDYGKGGSNGSGRND